MVCLLGVELGIRGRGDVAGDAKQGSEGVERVEATIEAERELVEVRLQMLWADAVMDAAQPSLEIGEHEVDHGQEGLGDLRIAPLRDCGMNISTPFECRITTPVVGDDGRAGRHCTLDEAAQRFGTSVWRHREPNSPGVPSSLALVEAAAMLTLSNLDSPGDENHVVNTSALAAGTAADVGFIGLDVPCGFATNPILIRPNHAGPQLVKYLEGGLIARQSELPLELGGRHSRCLAGDQVGRPKPDRERRVRALHDSAGGEACVAATFPATKYAVAGSDVSWFAGRPAMPANKPIAPSSALKIGHARRFVREQSLKLRQRARKRQIALLKYVDSHGRPRLARMPKILPVVGGCDNRISTVQTSLFRYEGALQTSFSRF